MNFQMPTKKAPRAIIIAEAGINHDGDLIKAKKSKKISITLPTRLLKKNIDQTKIEMGIDTNFKPTDIDEFIEAPNAFVTF